MFEPQKETARKMYFQVTCLPLFGNWARSVSLLRLARDISCVNFSQTGTSEKREKYRNARSTCVFLFICNNERHSLFVLKRASELKNKYNIYPALVDIGIFTSWHGLRCARLTLSYLPCLRLGKYVDSVSRAHLGPYVCALGDTAISPLYKLIWPLHVRIQGGPWVPAGGVNCSLYAAMELSSSFYVLGNLLRLVRNERRAFPVVSSHPAVRTWPGFQIKWTQPDFSWFFMRTIPAAENRGVNMSQ